MANHLESVYLQKGAASISSLSGSDGSIKIYRDDNHKKYSKLIAKAENNEIVPGTSSLDATANTPDPLSDDELVKQLAGSVPQPPNEPPKPKKKKTAKKNKKAHKQAVEATEPSTDVQSPDQDDKPLADALLTETRLESKEFETGVLGAAKEYRFFQQQIIKSSSGKSFPLHGAGGAANLKAGNGEAGWETVKSRVPNKHRGASAQVHHRPDISQTYAPRTPSLQVNSGNSSSQPPFRVTAPQHIPRGPAANFHQRAIGGGERWNQGGASLFQNKVAASSTAAQSMQSVPDSKNPQTPNKNQKTNQGPVVENVGAIAKQIPTSSARIFDLSEYPAMPSKLQVSNSDAQANNQILAPEVAQSLEKKLPEDTINASSPLTPDSRVKSCPSISSGKSLEVKQPIEASGDFGDEQDLGADTSTIISESRTSETPEPSVLAESEKTIDDFHGMPSSIEDDETLDDKSVGTEAIEQPEGSLPVDHDDETPEGSVDLIDDIQSDQNSSNKISPPISVDATQIAPGIQNIEQVSSQAESNIMTTNNNEQEEDPDNGRKMVDHQHEAHDEVLVSENQSVVSMARDLRTITCQPPFSSAPTFNNNIPPNYAFHHQLGWESPHHNANMAHPPPAPFYHPLGGMPVGIIPPYAGAIPPGPIPYQTYSAGPQFHPSQLPSFANINLTEFHENSQPMTFSHFTSPDATIRHPGEAQSGSPPQSAPYSPLEVPESLDMDVAGADEGAADVPQPATPNNAFRCSYCRDPTPTDGRTLVFCPGCGPTCNIRYCSTACLLADSYDHSTRCMNFPASQRLAFHNLPVQLIYEKEPIMSISGFPQSPEQFRQKAYMMYCHSGPFPATLAAWARRNSAESSLQGIDILERQKRTGDYHVFRSELTSVGPRCNAGADVIFTVFFREGEERAQKIFNRSLNACFLTYRHEIVKFLFLFIRHFIIDRDLFEMFPHQAGSTVVLEEFKDQFTREFGFDVGPYEHVSDTFRVDEECQRILPILDDLEMKYSILRHWMR